MELEQDHYDVVVIGTGLAESIAAASLANSGKSVLHLDPNEHYGAAQASLTLDELERWLSSQDAVPTDPASTVAGPASQSHPLITAPSSHPSPLTPELISLRRQYSLSLYPALLPSRGTLIQTLIDSGVSKYVGFRLLDGVSVWDDTATEASGAGSGSGSGSGPEPGVVQGTAEPVDAVTASSTSATSGSSGKARRVPGSKEEVFKDKSVSLVDKRRLMRFLMFVAGDFEQDAAYLGKETIPILDLLTQTFSLPRSLAERVAYAISHCSALTEPSSTALERTRRYLKSIGRYGPAAFLVGQYGGAGEIAQGFCRACAVKGGTYVLGPQAIPDSVERIDNTKTPAPTAERSDTDSAAANPSDPPRDGARWQLRLPCHSRPITASHIITTAEHVPQSPLSELSSLLHTSTNVPADGAAPEPESGRSVLRGIAILPSIPTCLSRQTMGNGGEGEEESAGSGDDTGVVLFPPASSETGRAEAREDERGAGELALVRALIMGEGTGSCPAGQYIVYLSAELTPSTSTANPPNPQAALQPYLNKIHPGPLYQAYYTQHVPVAPSTPGRDGLHVIRPFEVSGEMTEGLDWAAEQGKAVWESVMGRSAVGRGDEGGGAAEGDEGWWAGMGEQGDEEM